MFTPCWLCVRQGGGCERKLPVNKTINKTIIKKSGVMNIVSPGSHNISCPHFKRCSGCSIDQAVNTPPILNEVLPWFKERGISDFAFHVGKVVEWRYRAKLAVRGTPENPQIGLYEEGTHQVVDIPLCRVHHPAINRGVERVRDLITRYKLRPYNEETKSGDLRYLQFVVERSTGKLHITFVLNIFPENKDALNIWKKALEDLWENDPKNESHSISVNYNTRHDNVILSHDWDLWFGESFIWESFLGVRVCFLPSSFAQANMDQFESLLRTINTWVPEGASIAEYYAGVGVIGFTLASKAAWIRCCEINPHAEFCFNEAKKQQPEGVGEKISWSCGASTDYSGWLDEVDVVVVDPPRKGLEKRFLEDLSSVTNPLKLIYVSCGWESFKKDAGVLLKNGWVLNKAEGHLFFPGSNHVETLALFEKK